jgi:single-strand DNA-binding protein
MSGVNKATIVSRLGADIESKALDTGKTVANMSVATSEKWTDKDGQKQEKTEWHRCTVWGPQAENCARYLKKGSQVYVEGKLQTRKWQDQDGNDRYSTEIVAQTVQFLTDPKKSENSESASNEELNF